MERRDDGEILLTALGERLMVLAPSISSFREGVMGN